MRLGVPFIVPRQLGAVESIPGRQFLPSVAWRTGHCPVRISFLLWRSRPLEIQSRWRTGHCPVHTGQSGAPFLSLALPRVTRGLHGRPLARSTIGSPDSSHWSFCGLGVLHPKTLDQVLRVLRLGDEGPILELLHLEPKEIA
jgi:hypothetical protein